MRILSSTSLPSTPWKNGGGETIEIAVHPPGAGIDTFDWRISMATVASDGPFSIFPGIDRTLAILDGSGVHMVIAGKPPITLTAASPPLAFPADQPARVTLIGGAVTDLNVMSRRGRAQHGVERLAINRLQSLDTTAGTTIVFCQTGTVSIAAGGETGKLRPKDCAILNSADTPCNLTSATPAIAIIIRISALPQATPPPGSPQ
jgi:uncharacterized protein